MFKWAVKLLDRLLPPASSSSQSPDQLPLAFALEPELWVLWEPPSEEEKEAYRKERAMASKVLVAVAVAGSLLLGTAAMAQAPEAAPQTQQAKKLPPHMLTDKFGRTIFTPDGGTYYTYCDNGQVCIRTNPVVPGDEAAALRAIESHDPKNIISPQPAVPTGH